MINGNLDSVKCRDELHKMTKLNDSDTMKYQILHETFEGNNSTLQRCKN